MKPAVALLLAGIALAQAVHAQTWPSRPIRFVVPFGAGGGTDLVARSVAPRLSEALGQPVVVDNRGGAGGSIGMEITARAPADGHTLVLGSNGPLAINPALYASLSYDAVRDFAPVSMITQLPFVLVVHPVLPVKAVRELVALARARPGQLNYGSPGIGTTTHLATELLGSQTGTRMTHVPYKGVAASVTDLLGGQLQFMSGDLGTMLPHVKTGRMRAIAVTSARRSALLPDIPTIAESGVPGYDASGWMGLLAPAGTPQPVIDRLNAALVKGLAAPDTRSRLAALGGDVASSTPEQFTAFIRSEGAKWGRLIRALGIRADQNP